jgi:2'-5' RNA ligase
MVTHGGLGEFVRCFTALELPEYARADLEELVERLRPAAREADLRFAAPEAWHLTLKFLGDVERRRVPDCLAAVEAVAAQSAPVAVRCGEPHFFPPGGLPRIIALDIEDATPTADAPAADKAPGPLERLAREIEEALVPCGVAREARRFRPHLTLARLRGARGLEALRAALAREAEFALGELDFAEVVFFQSELGAADGGGPRHTPLGRLKLGG